MSCKSCKFWKVRCSTAEYTFPGVRWGHCRRYPPKLNKMHALFPEVDEDNWCGEWRER